MPGAIAVSLARDLLYGLDPISFAADCGMPDLDPWQRKFLAVGAEATGKRNVLILASRQVGKTESCILRALHVAHTEPGETVVVVSSRQETSNEFILRAKAAYAKLPAALELVGDAVTRITLANGSRIIGLPSSEDGIRGIPRVRGLLVDEAVRVSDGLYGACRPMLVVHPRGELIGLTSAGNASGWFYDSWQDPETIFEKIEIPASSCPRLTPEVLANERKALGETRYKTEYLLEWLAAAEAAFDPEILARCFNNKEIRPLWM
jgi:hypothetical protein